MTVGGGGGWSSSNGKTLSGTNIILAALSTCWRVLLVSGEINLGHDNLENRRVSVKGLDADFGLHVVEYNAPEKSLVIMASPAGLASDKGPVGQNGVCGIREPHTLSGSESCVFWVSNTAVTVSWEMLPVADLPGVKDLVVRTVVHRAEPCGDQPARPTSSS